MEVFSSARCLSLVLLSALVGSCLASCGCPGSNQIYIQYKPPLTGWFLHNPRKGSFRRELTMEQDGSTVGYILNYTSKKQWVLLERFSRRRGLKKIAVLGDDRDSTAPLIRVFCPQKNCSCSRVSVEGADYLNGRYYRSDIFEEESKEELSRILEQSRRSNSNVVSLRDITRPLNISAEELPLASLTHCVRGKGEEETNEGSLHKLTPRASEVYSKSDQSFNLTRAPEGSFWWIEMEGGIYAVSRDGSHCLHHLPKHTKWMMLDKSKKDLQDKESMTVTCYEYVQL